MAIRIPAEMYFGSCRMDAWNENSLTFRRPSLSNRTICSEGNSEND